MNELFIDTLRSTPASQLPALRQSLQEQLASAERGLQHCRAENDEITPVIEALESRRIAEQELAEAQAIAGKSLGYPGPRLDMSAYQSLLARQKTLNRAIAEHNFNRIEAQVRLKMLDEGVKSPGQRWAKTARDWLAVIAIWIVGFYGLGWGFIVLISTGAGAALLVLLKALAIASVLLLVGRQATVLLTRRRRQP